MINMEEDYSYYCSFECFNCKKKREKAVKSPALREEEPRKDKSIEKDEKPWRHATLKTIIAVMKDELDMAWNQRMQQNAVDDKKPEDESLNGDHVTDDEEEKRLTSVEGDIDKRDCDGKPSSQNQKVPLSVVHHEEPEDKSLNKDHGVNDKEEKGLTLGEGDIDKRDSNSKPNSQIGDDKPKKSTSKKRRRLILYSSDSDSEERERSGENKKLKRKKQKIAEAPRFEVAPALMVDVRKADNDPFPALPGDFEARMRDIEGRQPILILQKKLFNSDVAKGENRLSIPLKQIQREFLTEEEEMRVIEGMSVTIIEPSLQLSNIVFKKWKMKKSCYLYVFINQWNSLVTRNALKAGDLVQVWSFRVGGSELGFALIKVKEPKCRLC